MKIIIPSDTIDNYARLDVLLGLKLSGYTDTPAAASTLIEESYKSGGIQNEEQYRDALNKIHTI